MRNFLRENWFKLIIIVFAFLYILILAYEQYAVSVSHNYELFKYCVSMGLKPSDATTDQAKDIITSCQEALSRHNFYLPF